MSATIEFLGQVVIIGGELLVILVIVFFVWMIISMWIDL